MLNHPPHSFTSYAPSLSNQRSPMLDIVNLLCQNDKDDHSSIPPTSSIPHQYQHRLFLLVEDDDWSDQLIKSKRRRASHKQLQVLNRVFQHTSFPSTQVRAQLGRQLGMSPRTVQIWFQNRRQAVRTKERRRGSSLA
ncbi:hypothetical protein BC941DRAFT_356890 [Chlamydoabsidia padenii]|nr:hypothetical protein BC941DRAFT_356890 [Chlamydoabsidia padenii]